MILFMHFRNNRCAGKAKRKMKLQNLWQDFGCFSLPERGYLMFTKTAFGIGSV